MGILGTIRRRLVARFKWLRRVRRWIERAPGEVLRRVSFTTRLGPPKGTFSLEAMVRRGEVEGRIVREPAPIPLAAEGSVQKLCEELGLQKPHRLFPVFWARWPQARLAGETLLLVNERKEACREALFFDQTRDDAGYHSLWLPPAVPLTGNWTSLVALTSQFFYHWMIEALPRLAMLPELPPDTRILVHGELFPFQEESLRLLKLETRIRRTPERHLTVENFYFLSPAAMTGTQHPASIRFLRDTFLPLAEDFPDAPKSIFISRRDTGVGSRGVVNDDEVRAVFARRGWDCPDLAAMPLTRQIALFAQADRICAVHGGALTHLLWCRPECKVLELCSSTYPNGCYEILAARVGVDYRAIMFTGLAYGSVRIDLAQLEGALDAMG